jgi:hypothetical protein
MASNNFNTSKSNSASAAVTGGADEKASKAVTPDTKPVDEQRQGRGVMAGRGGGAFDTAKTTPDNK